MRLSLGFRWRADSMGARCAGECAGSIRTPRVVPAYDDLVARAAPVGFTRLSDLVRLSPHVRCVMSMSCDMCDRISNSTCFLVAFNSTGYLSNKCRYSSPVSPGPRPIRSHTTQHAEHEATHKSLSTGARLRVCSRGSSEVAGRNSYRPGPGHITTLRLSRQPSGHISPLGRSRREDALTPMNFHTHTQYIVLARLFRVSCNVQLPRQLSHAFAFRWLRSGGTLAHCVPLRAPHSTRLLPTRAGRCLRRAMPSQQLPAHQQHSSLAGRSYLPNSYLPNCWGKPCPCCIPGCMPG